MNYEKKEYYIKKIQMLNMELNIEKNYLIKENIMLLINYYRKELGLRFP